LPCAIWDITASDAEQRALTRWIEGAEVLQTALGVLRCAGALEIA
jgi:hypothetical protein